MSVSISGTNGLTFGDGSAQNTGGYTGFRNRIINGAMMIDQRNAGASVTPSTSSYTLDRWRLGNSAGARVSVQQSSDAPSGFANSALITTVSQYTVAAAEEINFGQRIEGFNFADFGFGTANAKPIVLSFWVKSSLTGLFGGCLGNGNDGAIRRYVFSYTINSANTWEYKTVTIPGDTTGTWIGATNGLGLIAQFAIATGSNLLNTSGAWQSAVLSGVTGQNQLVATNGATWQVTGVQLEKGSVATPFEFRPYGTELTLCQRYCVVYSTEQSGYRLGLGYAYSTTAGVSGFNLPVTMRTPPSISGTPSNVTFNDSVGGYNAGTPTINSSQENFVTLTATASGMTAGRGNQMYFTNPSSKLILSAEM